jgi:DNA-binding CsgD family transcriptional regulator
LLTGGSRTALPRQRTLESSVAWSHDLLEDRERALLRRLSVFAGGFTLDAAELVCHDDLVDRYAVLDLLSRLVDKSLVQVDHENTDARYRLLETIRYFARERLVEQGESDATRQRHLSYFVDLAELAAPEIVAANGPVWLVRLEQEHDNLRAALEWAETAHEDDLFLRLAGALTLFWELRGHLSEGGRWFARALASEDGASVVRARALWGAAHVALYGDDVETTMLRIPEALAMAEAVGDDWATARALNTFGYLQAGSDPAAGRTALEKSVILGRAIGDDWAVADGLKMLGVTWIFQDDHDAALIALDQLRDIARALDNKFFIAWYHCGVGFGAVRRGEFEAARRELETSLEYCREVGEPATAGIAIALLGGVEALTGHDADTVARLETFLQRANATGGGLGVPQAVIELASLTVGHGNPTGARELVEPLVGQLRELGLSTWLSWSLSVLGASLVASGDASGARAALDEARAVAGAPLHNPWLAALANHCLGQLARQEGDISQAEDLHHDALVLRHEHRFLPGVAQSLEALAGIAATQESGMEAARLYGAADALRRVIGLVRLPIEQEEYDADVALARAQLGDEAFDTGWVEGTALSTEDAVAYASRARGERKRPSSGWDSLTPTEQRVVALAATGLTNPKIAEQMFISRGTVKVHLAHIFAKLSVSTRAELAAEATRRADKHTGSYERVPSTRRPR